MREIEFLEQSKVKKVHYAYMVRCADNTIYSGYSTNPVHREQVHNSGKGAKYTRNRLPVKLVYVEMFESKSEAMKREWGLKQLTHKQKEELISSQKADTIYMKFNLSEGF